MYIFANKRRLFLISVTLLLTGVGAGLLHHFEIDDTLHSAYWQATTSEQQRSQSIWLTDYNLVQKVELEGVDNNASGLAWNPQTGTLFAVINGSNDILELSRQGDVLRRINMNGFRDVEAITWIGDDKYIIADERYQSLVAITINEETVVVERADSPSITIGIGAGDNKGFEGVAWDPSDKGVFVARERDPSRIMKVYGFEQGAVMQFSVEPSEDIDKAALTYKSDLSGLHYDPTRGHLLVLSHESGLLTEINRKGEVLSFMELAKGWHGLKEDVPQAEGVTMDDEGNIYLLSEPNLFYKFSKTL